MYYLVQHSLDAAYILHMGTYMEVSRQLIDEKERGESDNLAIISQVAFESLYQIHETGVERRYEYIEQSTEFEFF